MTPEIRTLISGVILMTKYLNFPLTKVGSLSNLSFQLSVYDSPASLQ